MEPIYIPQLLTRPQQTETLDIRNSLPELPTLTPVQGTMSVTHQGQYLQVTARVETIVTLACDRCLQQYNHRLICDCSEMIWLEDTPQKVEQPGGEIEVLLENLVETLPPKGHFDPQDWLYQQLCLALPQRQLCDSKCPGLALQTEKNREVDSRWAALEALKKSWNA
jgi:uncharacterized protein